MLFKEHELKYQLYENNLCLLCPLDNPDEAQLQAMNSMLMERGWSMEDVSYLTTSPLSPRSPEGWLEQGSKLGVSMEYALIEGFVLDLENPSLQLLVVKADETHVGLISQNDLSECLQLPNTSLLIFSALILLIKTIGIIHFKPSDMSQKNFKVARYYTQCLKQTT